MLFEHPVASHFVIHSQLSLIGQVEISETLLKPLELQTLLILFKSQLLLNFSELFPEEKLPLLP